MCEIKKEYMDFDKSDIAPQLSHLSHLQIAELISRYYNNETHSDLTAKFRIRFEPSDYSEIFPLVKIKDSFCTICKEHLYRKFFCRITRKSIFSTPFCRHCKIEKQIKAIESEVSEIKAIRSRSIQSILNICFKDAPHIRETSGYQSPLLLNFIYPVILRNCAKRYNEYTLYGLEPNTKLMPLCDSQMLEELLVAGCIRLESSTTTKALVINQNRVVDLNIFAANWSINTEQGFSKFMAMDQLNTYSAKTMGWITNWNREIKNVWLKIVTSECLEFMLITSAQNGYPVKGAEASNHIKVALERLIDKYTESQCFRIIWAICQYCSKCLQHNGIYNRDYKQINSFTAETFDERCEGFLQDNFDVCGTNRPLFSPRSKLNQMFFNDILKFEGDSGFHTLLSDCIKK